MKAPVIINEQKGYIMEEKIKLEWGRKITGELLERWPKDENGELIEPVFLTHCASIDMSDEMLVNLLEAYEIPCVRQYPNDGDFGRLVLGMSGTGVDIYVPITMYEDAVNLSEGSAEYEEL